MEGEGVEWRCLTPCPSLPQYDYAHVQRLSKMLVDGITSQIPDVIRNGDPEKNYPGSPSHL